MKSFKFVYGDNFEIVYRDGELEINQHDEWGNWVGMVTVPMPALLAIHEEAEKLYPYHNPSCKEVSEARSALEKARDVRNVAEPDKAFEKALRAYVEITERHKEAFGCQTFH